MHEQYPPLRVDATPDDILAVLRDLHRQACYYDFVAKPDISLSHDSTIDQWREACDLLPWRQLGKAQNAYWSVAIPMTEWKAVLHPPKERKLGGVCELLARHAKVPRVRPVEILGSRCTAGGAFLTIRSLLAEAGADVSAIAPSTPLDEYTRRYLDVFLARIPQLAPGVLPRVKIHTPTDYGLGCAALIAFVVMLAAVIYDLYTLRNLACLVLVASLLTLWAIRWWGPPTRYEFLGLRTFRDLSEVIAAGTSA